MTHKLASAAPRTTRATQVAAPTALLDADEPCSPDVEAEEDVFVVEQAAAHVVPPIPTSAVADVAPPPFDLADDEEPPFDAPDPDDEVFQTRRQTLELDVGDLIEGDGDALSAAPAPQSPRAPAISIHVSWERDGAQALLTAFASDARLARTEITAARGGIEAAYARFGKMPSPDLLVLDTALGPKALLADLDPLLMRLDARTKIIVVGEANDVGLVRDLARRGVAYYLLSPQPDEVISRICDLYAAYDNARVIAVVGARGGVGASTVAQNVAWSIAERQHASTALVDLELSFGVAGFDFEEPAQSMGVGFLAPDIVDDAFLDRAAVKQGEKLSVYAAPPSVAQPFDLEADAVKRVIARVRRTAQFVVLDVPHQWAAWVKEVLIGADEVVIVATPDLASLRNAKSIMEVLKEGRKNRSEPLYVLSMVGAAKGPEISSRDYTEAMDAKPVDQLEFDPALFGMCALKNKAIGAAAPRSKAAATIDGLAWVLTGREPGVRPNAKDVLARVAPPAATCKPAEDAPAPSPAAVESVAKAAPLAPDGTPQVVAREPTRRRASQAHQRTYASASSNTAHKRGAVRAALTVAAVVLACAFSMQSRDLVHVLGAASGVLH